jgi:16S rRNA (cytosine1402-N4)-methyltransferase
LEFNGVKKVEFHHTSVLLEESVTALITNAAGVYIDCTLGGAGHSSAIATRLAPEGHLISIDQDLVAVATGKERLKQASCSVTVVHDNFRNLEAILNSLAIESVDGVLFDLGVSSYQLDTAERGFSYMQDAPLDMRMDPRQAISAYHVVNEYPEQQLAKVIIDYGEERWARRIAQFICKARQIKPVETTGQLVEIIKQAIPAAARREGPHPAKRTFQALRIEVNNELGILRNTFETAAKRLRIGGRLCIITFHSLEDRIAKQTMQGLTKACICPPQMPICVCQNKPTLKMLGKPILPSEDEVESNPRARSAKLRVALRV